MISRGERFERQVLRALRRALAQGALGLVPEMTKVFHRRAYYSQARKKDIIVDVAVELRLAGADVPSILWIWECKDYSSSVPVDDVEEFHAKLEQIGADNTKGTIVTRSSFQSSAFEYARSNGIGLARLFAKDEIDWVLHRPTDLPLYGVVQPRPRIAAAITDPVHVPINHSVLGFTGGELAAECVVLDQYIALQVKEWKLAL